MRISSIGAIVFSLWVGLCTTSVAVGEVVGEAVERPLPADGKLGKLAVSEQRQFLIDGDEYRLSAGTQIRTAQNTIIQPQTLIPKLAGVEAWILYTKKQGQIHRIWLLTKQEARRYLAKLPPPEPPPPPPPPNREATTPSIPPDRTATPSTPTQ